MISVMAWYFLFLNLVTSIIIVVCQTPGRLDYNGCHDSTWTYDSASHTCIKPIREGRNWNKAKEYCHSNFKGGIGKTKEGHLVRILESQTNDLIKGLISGGWIGWIGLHYSTQESAYRWEGYLNEDPDFVDWMNSAQESSSFPYVYIHGQSGWGKRNSPTTTHHFVCQHDATIPETTISCPNEPLRVNQSPTGPTVTITFYFNYWSNVLWNDIQAVRDVSPCTVCPLLIPPLVQTWNNDGQVTISYTGNITRKQEGTWTISIHSTNSKLLDTKTCNVKVYEPASNIQCTNHLIINSLSVVCYTPRIYPKAVCKWFYKYENENVFKSVESNQVNGPTHTQNGQSSDPYFRSECSILMTPTETTVFKAGTIVVKIEMYPDVNGFNLSQTQDALQDNEQMITIVLPDAPRFQFMNGTAIGSSLTLYEEEVIMLKCVVPSGNPNVQRTTLSCGFKFNGQKEADTVDGMSYNMSITASRDVNGKTCECFGKHITGDTEKTNLTFIVFSAAKIENLAANEEKNLTVVAGTEVTISCRAVGHPVPEVNILKISSNGIHERLQTNVQEGETKATFQSKCSDNARYRCQATNTVDGVSNKVMDDIVINVNCPPTSCHESGNGFQIDNTGQPATLTLCVRAYPVPNNKGFSLERENGEVWSTMAENYTITIVTNSNDDIVEGITVTFQALTSSHSGKYRLVYSDGGKVYHIDFEIKADADDGGKGTDITIIAVAIVIPVVIIIIIVILCLIWKRRSRGKDKSKDYKVTNGTRRSGNETEESASQYVNVKPKVSKDTSKDKDMAFYNNVIYVNDEKEDVKVDDTPYSNPPNNQEQNTKVTKNDNPQEPELEYVQIDFGQADRGKTAPVQKEVKTTETPRPMEDQEIEYSGIDFQATSQLQNSQKNKQISPYNGAEDKEEMPYANT